MFADCSIISSCDFNSKSHDLTRYSKDGEQCVAVFNGSNEIKWQYDVQSLGVVL